MKTPTKTARSIKAKTLIERPKISSWISDDLDMPFNIQFDRAMADELSERKQLSVDVISEICKEGIATYYRNEVAVIKARAKKYRINHELFNLNHTIDLTPPIRISVNTDHVSKPFTIRFSLDFAYQFAHSNPSGTDILEHMCSRAIQALNTRQLAEKELQDKFSNIIAPGDDRNVTEPF